MEHLKKSIGWKEEEDEHDLQLRSMEFERQFVLDKFKSYWKWQIVQNLQTIEGWNFSEFEITEFRANNLFVATILGLKELSLTDDVSGYTQKLVKCSHTWFFDERNVEETVNEIIHYWKCK